VGLWPTLKFPIAFSLKRDYNDYNISKSEDLTMRQHSLTTASFFFTYGQARFMSTGYFAVGEKGWTK
jgi:hypothetical protein